MYQHNWDSELEKQKYGDQWLLTESIATSIDSFLANNGALEEENTVGSRKFAGQNSEEHERQDVKEGSDIAADAVPAAHLLDLSTWLNLSDRVFMNAGGQRKDENWSSLTEDDEELGIFHSAFADFHKLAVSVTRRLVHVSLNQATSRLRARDKPYHEPTSEPSVRKQDVITALDILNMPKNAREFWIRAPRRSGVLVYSKLSQLKDEDLKTLTYDEVERKLEGKPGRPHKSTTTQNGGNGVPADAESDSDAISQSDGAEDDMEDDESCDITQEEYAEQRDQEQSQLEELQLWEILGQPRPSTLALVAGKLPRRPPIDRKVGGELSDWRDLVDYKSEWERYGATVPEERFKETYQRMQRARGAASRTRRGSSRLLQAVEALDATGVDAMDADGNFLLGERATEVPQTTDEEDLEEQPTSSEEEAENTVAGTKEEEDDDADGRKDQGLPIRRTLQPRHARDSAASSMAALPPYSEVEESSGDEYQHDGNGSP
ncbi:uncharacterized protein K452DRAFT_293158 [Aplosporella prunicola CBS 121167]|uniref:Uncharacterized protein n=1 Tax=Aplosporella prunicola CBS 121167 TaxID=1176127 RepID=A0A6A6AW83_9PEZI|nr:uncharacterized protein K452DRAFT_293158 [Aplosporella prunicola CBS 121167]KAF2135518.1 hypothetical protein K452DRAFT_293158 [Aplosporella prunicola CBS 121167]